MKFRSTDRGEFRGVVNALINVGAVFETTSKQEAAEAIIKGSLIRQVCGDQDETFGPNRDFHEHLERLKIPHAWTVLPGVDHNPMKTLEALGDSNWKFYRAAFGQPPEVPAICPSIKHDLNLKCEQHDTHQKFPNPYILRSNLCIRSCNTSRPIHSSDR
jgi:hypothetical protein